eukprot:scaffold47188_cov22-Tisochrysis_lutea.AAC.1
MPGMRTSWLCAMHVQMAAQPEEVQVELWRVHVFARASVRALELTQWLCLWDHVLELDAMVAAQPEEAVELWQMRAWLQVSIPLLTISSQHACVVSWGATGGSA